MTNSNDAKADTMSITLGKDDATKDDEKPSFPAKSVDKDKDTGKKDTKRDDGKKDDAPEVEIAPRSDEPRDDAYPKGRKGNLQQLADRYEWDAWMMEKQNFGSHEVHHAAATAQLLRELAEV